MTQLQHPIFISYTQVAVKIAKKFNLQKTDKGHKVGIEPLTEDDFAAKVFFLQAKT